MIKYLIPLNGAYMVECRSKPPAGEYYVVDYEYMWPEVYEIIDGEVVLSEAKLFNHVDKLRKEAYERGEWDFKIDLNL